MEPGAVASGQCPKVFFLYGAFVPVAGEPVRSGTLYPARLATAHWQPEASDLSELSPCSRPLGPHHPAALL